MGQPKPPMNGGADRRGHRARWEREDVGFVGDEQPRQQ
jgi:hypothetical protein